MTVIRRPRNEISRNRQWAEMAADLLDEGMTDAEVAAELDILWRQLLPVEADLRAWLAKQGEGE